MPRRASLLSLVRQEDGTRDKFEAFFQSLDLDDSKSIDEAEFASLFADSQQQALGAAREPANGGDGLSDDDPSGSQRPLHMIEEDTELLARLEKEAAIEAHEPRSESFNTSFEDEGVPKDAIRRSADKYVSALRQLSISREGSAELDSPRLELNRTPSGSFTTSARSLTASARTPGGTSRTNSGGGLIRSASFTGASPSGSASKPKAEPTSFTRSASSYFSGGRRSSDGSPAGAETGGRTSHRKEAMLKAAMSADGRRENSSFTSSRRSSLSGGGGLSRSPSFGSSSPRNTAINGHDIRHHWP